MRMKLAYVDESYTSGCFVMGAVLIDDASGPVLHHALEDIAERARTLWLPGREGPLELHGNPIFQGTGPYEPIAHEVRKLISIYEDSMHAVGASGARIFLQGLDTGRHRAHCAAPGPPSEVVLQHLLEQIDVHARSNGEQVLVICDEVDDANRQRDRLRDFRAGGTSDFGAARLGNILDTLHFAPSCHSRLVQAADLVAFLWRRRLSVVESSPKKAVVVERIWRLVEPAVIHQHHHRPAPAAP